MNKMIPHLSAHLVLLCCCLFLFSIPQFVSAAFNRPSDITVPSKNSASRTNIAVAATCATLPTIQYNALYDLYTATQGSKWIWSTTTSGIPWNFTTTASQVPPNPCVAHWQGITCDFTKCNVLQLVLPSYNLNGTLPSSIQNLVNLNYLYLYSNNLNGPIPSSIGTLVKLTNLRLDINALTGTIPPALSALVSLSTLDLSENQLVGSIPSNLFASMAALRNLYLGNNQLTGTIPSTLDVNLVMLSLYTNNLNGTIPPEIGHLTYLKYLYLQDNSLSGTIPPSIGNLTNLNYLYLSSNALNGSIPSSIGNLVHLTYLYLQDNFLSGTIPSSIATIATLTTVNIGNNSFTGHFANSSLLALPALSSLSISLNNFTGTLPVNISRWIPTLQTLLVNGNLLTGTIPTNFCNLTKLTELFLSDNQFHGHIPSCIGNLNKLQHFGVDTNRLSGSYPASITDLTAMISMDISENDFTGKIPEAMSNLQQLTELWFDTNHLTGTIPASLGTLTALTKLWMHRNQLHGEIPSSLGQLQSLEELTMYSNYLTGTIPDSLTNLQSVYMLQLSDNLLNGSLPAQLGDLTALQSFSANLNQLTGSLPASIMNCISLLSINVANNMLTGPLPPNFLQNKVIVILANNFFTGALSNTVPGISWIRMQQLVVFNNFFTGNVQDLSTHGMITLQALELQNNYFVGNINDVIYYLSPKQPLALIDLSNNAITGSVSENIFNLPALAYFAVVKNCITGSVPSNICNRKDTLQVLAMDGTHSSTACQQKSGLLFSHAYVESSAMTGRLPACLFTDMKVLNTLHMSGNRLTGSLPGDIAAISSNLKNLSLSHNAFTGTIPVVFQQNVWHELDLSFNKFTGILSEDFHVNPQVTNATVSLNQNRISGKIPGTLKSMANIDVLSGNMFQCHTNRADLPSNDPKKESYQCGSDEVNDAITTYLVTTSVLVLGTALFIWMLRSNSATDTAVKPSAYLSLLLTCAQTFFYPSTLSGQFAMLREYLHMSRAICQRLVVFTAITSSVLLTVYIALGYLHSSYEHRYAWQVSIAYLSGTAAATTLLVCFMLLTLLLFSKIPNVLDLSYIFSPSTSAEPTSGNNLVPSKPEVSVPSEASGSVSASEERLSLCLFCVVVLTNAVVVFVVNGYYVFLVISNISPSEASVLAFALSCFKTGWKTLLAYVFRSKTLSRLEGVLGTNAMSMVISGVCIFNSILVPCIATIFVNTNCFYYAVVQADSVDTSFTTSYCSSTETQYGIDTCINTEVLNFETVYKPAFSYSYLCSSSLLATFASVWMFMFVINGVISPLSKISLMYLFANQWKYVKPVGKWLPLPLLPAAEIKARILAANGEGVVLTNELATVARSLCNSRETAINTVNTLAVILCFGLLFPPIAIAGCTAFIVQCISQQFFIFRIVGLCEEGEVEESTVSLQQRVDAVLLAVQDNWKAAVGMIQTQCVMLVGLVGIFWSFFLWDILGDEVGWRDSMWIALLLMAWTACIYVLQQYHDHIFSFVESNPIIRHGIELLTMKPKSPDTDINSSVKKVTEESSSVVVEVINPIACKTTSSNSDKDQDV